MHAADLKWVWQVMFVFAEFMVNIKLLFDSPSAGAAEGTQGTLVMFLCPFYSNGCDHFISMAPCPFYSSSLVPILY